MKELRKSDIRLERARLEGIPYMLIVGQKEEESGVVSVRSRYLGDEGQRPIDEFVIISAKIRTKKFMK